MYLGLPPPDSHSNVKFKLHTTSYIITEIFAGVQFRIVCARIMSDGNFLDNRFSIALSKQFSDLYAKACATKCIICISIKSSLHVLSRGKHRTLIPKAELGLHIFQPSPLQSLKEGLYDCVQNGYSVKIERPTGGKNGIIRGYSGFARSYSAQIHSEVYWTRFKN